MESRLVEMILQRRALATGFRIECHGGKLRLEPIGDKKETGESSNVAALLLLMREKANRAALVDVLGGSEANEANEANEGDKETGKADLARLFPSRPASMREDACGEPSAGRGSVAGSGKNRYAITRADSWRSAIPVRKDRRGTGDDRPMVDLVDLLDLFAGEWSDSVVPEVSGSARMLGKLIRSPSRFKSEQAEREAREMVAAWEGVVDVFDAPDAPDAPDDPDAPDATDGFAECEDVADPKDVAVPELDSSKHSLEMPSNPGARTGKMRTETRWHTWEGWRDVPSGATWTLATDHDWRKLSRRDQIEFIRIVQKRADAGLSTRIVVLEGEICAIKGEA